MKQQIRVKYNRFMSDEDEHWLRRIGLVPGEGFLYGEVSDRKLRKVEKYCKRENLRLDISSGFSERSGYYRRKFMSTHKPQLGPFYICAYCGKLLTAKKVTVDHLYPVKEAARDPKIMRKLHRIGIYDVNDQRNLVCACERCNKRKAASMGVWIIKGKIGRHTLFWVVWKSIKLFALIVVIGYAYGAVQQMR